MTLRRETGPLLRNPIQYRRDRDSFAHALEIAKPFGVLESVLDWCKDELIEEWRWQLLIRTPDFVREADLRQALTALLKRGKAEAAKRVRLESLTEGPCVQMLHVGPYERECDTIALMQAFAEKKQLKFSGRHHEIYLSDPRRVPLERLKTILRHPVRLG